MPYPARAPHSPPPHQNSCGGRDSSTQSSRTPTPFVARARTRARRIAGPGCGLPLGSPALEAVVLNLLSVAAAWGLSVLIWQNGYGSNAIWGIEATQAINVEMPIVIFAFLFGISMDYQVFIISRMRESYDTS